MKHKILQKSSLDMKCSKDDTYLYEKVKARNKKLKNVKENVSIV